jgi:hypothetical protein
MSPRSHETFWDQDGGFGEAVTVCQWGAPERLCGVSEGGLRWRWSYDEVTYLTDVTSQFLATAALHILDPRKPLPPKTTIRLVAAIFYLV